MKISCIGLVVGACMISLGCNEHPRTSIVNADSLCTVEVQGLLLSAGRPVEDAIAYLSEELDSAIGIRRHEVGKTDASGEVFGRVVLFWGEEARLVETSSSMEVHSLTAERPVTVEFYLGGKVIARKVFDLNEHELDDNGAVRLECELDVVADAVSDDSDDPVS